MHCQHLPGRLRRTLRSGDTQNVQGVFEGDHRPDTIAPVVNVNKRCYFLYSAPAAFFGRPTIVGGLRFTAVLLTRPSIFQPARHPSRSMPEVGFCVELEKNYSNISSTPAIILEGG